MRVTSVVVAVVLWSCHPASLRGSREDGRLAAERYLSAWSRGEDLPVVEDSARLRAQRRRFREALGILGTRHALGAYRPQPDGESALQEVRVIHTLRGLGDWAYTLELPLLRTAAGWSVKASSENLHPELQEGDDFSRTRASPVRGHLLDGAGVPLTSEGEVIAVGVRPDRVRDERQVVEALRRTLGTSDSRVRTVLERGQGQHEFLSVIELRPERFAQVRASLEPIPGIFFRRTTARLAPDSAFALHTLGRVGEITAEALAELGASYQRGDQVGLWGLERAFEAQLAGRPSGEIRLITASGAARVLHRFEGEPSRDVQTTLDRRLQRVAETILAGVDRPAALVALDRRNGEVRAVVSAPANVPFHRALSGRYPPGSVFKIVTTEALLEAGFVPETQVACPATLGVSGKLFRNFEGEELGDTPLRTAFAHSCNTAFVGLAQRLGPGALQRAAERFGFNVELDPGLPVGLSVFPTPQDELELAAAAIGQGRVLATPLHLASVAAAAASGSWHAPRLVRTLEARRSPLAAGTVAPLTAMMRSVVAEGSAKRAAGHLPRLVGKTGTAEFGTARPPETHAWFVGVIDDLAVSVLVEGGGAGGRVAAPLAAKFVEGAIVAP